MLSPPFILRLRGVGRRFLLEQELEPAALVPRAGNLIRSPMRRLNFLERRSRKQGSDRADRLAGKATLTGGSLLGRSEVLRSLRHYLRAQSQGHHTIGHLEERGMGRGSARRSSLKGREMAIVNQTNIGTVSKATLRKFLRHGVKRIWTSSQPRMQYIRAKLGIDSLENAVKR